MGVWQGSCLIDRFRQITVARCSRLHLVPRIANVFKDSLPNCLD